MLKLILSIIILSTVLFPFFTISEAETPEKILVFTSILPQKYFVDRIGGNFVDVKVMVGPGRSPATYEPTPKKISELSKANIYFSVGVPFENVWIKKIEGANPDLKMVDTLKGITLRTMESHKHGHHDHGGLKDPHIWLSPSLVKVQAGTISNALCEVSPSHREYFMKNLELFQRDLDKLIVDIDKLLKPLKRRQIMLFHPVLGYFCDEFNFEQISIEVEGKEPGAKTLGEIIEKARANRIRTIFVQQQFSQVTAKRVAESVGAEAIIFDPLAYEYDSNMLYIARLIERACRGD